MVAALLSASVAAVPSIPGKWEKVDLKPSALVKDLYLNTTKVVKNSSKIRTGVTYHQYDPRYDKWPNGTKFTHGVRVAMHDCEEKLFIIIVSVFYGNENLIQRGDIEDIQLVSSDPLFIAEHNAICSIPEKKLLLDPKNGDII